MCIVYYSKITEAFQDFFKEFDLKSHETCQTNLRLCKLPSSKIALAYLLDKPSTLFFSKNVLINLAYFQKKNKNKLNGSHNFKHLKLHLNYIKKKLCKKTLIKINDSSNIRHKSKIS